MNNTEKQDDVRTIDLEVAPIEQITKAEINQQIATAMANPRNMKKFLARAEAMITIDQDTAESCIYRLRRRDPQAPGGYKIIEGESVRMAEIVAACYGNLRSAVQIIGHTPTRVSVRAVCHDLESNNLIAVEKQARTTYSDGSPYNDDMAITATNAVVSKALRDAIFRVVPKALVKPLKIKAKEVAFGDGQIFAERRQKAVDWATKTRQVPLPRVLAALQVQSVENMTVEHLEILTGLKNAIMDGDQKVEEAFPPLEAETKPVMEHPEKTKQNEQAQSKSKVTPKETAKPKEEPKTETPKNVVEMPKETTTPATAEPVQDPEPQQPDPGPDPAKESASTPEPEPAMQTEPKVDASKQPTSLSEAQKQLKAEIEGRGFLFHEFVEWGSASIFKVNKPVDWTQIPDDKAKFFVKSIVGIQAALKTWKQKAAK